MSSNADIDAWLSNDRSGVVNFVEVSWSSRGLRLGQNPLLLGRLDDGILMIFQVCSCSDDSFSYILSVTCICVGEPVHG